MDGLGGGNGGGAGAGEGGGALGDGWQMHALYAVIVGGAAQQAHAANVCESVKLTHPSLGPVLPAGFSECCPRLVEAPHPTRQPRGVISWPCAPTGG